MRRHPNVPRDLRLRLFFFFSDTWTKTRASRGSFVANDRALLAELPDALRRETRFRALETVARAAFADDAAESEEEEKISERALRAVADALEPRLVSRNERLDAANTFALVREGEVEVALSSHPSSEKKGAFADDHDEKKNVDGEPSRRVVVEAGAFFGVASFLRSEDRQTAHARVEAVAVSECEVYEMDAERAGALGDEFPELRRGAERALALRDF